LTSKPTASGTSSAGFGAFASAGGGFGSFASSTSNAPSASVFGSSGSGAQPATGTKPSSSGGFSAFASSGGGFGSAAATTTPSIFSIPSTESIKEDSLEKPAPKLAFPTSGGFSTFSSGNNVSPFTASTPTKTDEKTAPSASMSNVFGIPKTSTTPQSKPSLPPVSDTSPKPPSTQQESKVGY
jgi:hypothetical protein